MNCASCVLYILVQELTKFLPNWVSTLYFLTDTLNVCLRWKFCGQPIFICLYRLSLGHPLKIFYRGWKEQYGCKIFDPPVLGTNDIQGTRSEQYFLAKDYRTTYADSIIYFIRRLTWKPKYWLVLKVFTLFYAKKKID